MPPATTPALTLDNGVTMPALGLGVFQTPPDETRDAVRAALDADDGLRLALYTAEVGSASQQALDLLASWSTAPAGHETR